MHEQSQSSSQSPRRREARVYAVNIAAALEHLLASIARLKARERAVRGMLLETGQ